MLGSIAGSMLAPAFAGRFRKGLVLAGSMAVAAAGLGLLVFVSGGAVPPALLEAARDAFVEGLQPAALTGAVLMAVTAAVTALVLRRRGERVGEGCATAAS